MFNNIESLTIPEGDVIKIECDGIVLWEKKAARMSSEYQEVEYIENKTNPATSGS